MVFVKIGSHTLCKFTIVIVYNSLFNIYPFINLGFNFKKPNKLLFTFIIDVFQTYNETHFTS